MNGFKEFVTAQEAFDHFAWLNACAYGPTYLLEDRKAAQTEYEQGRQAAPWRSDIRHFFGKNAKINKSDLMGGKMGGVAGVNQDVLSSTLGEAGGYVSYVVHLTPAAQSGFITCPLASLGCKSTCLNTAGNIGALADKTGARLKRTWWLAKEMPNVLSNMVAYLKRLRDRVEATGNKLVIRLNGTSDLRWEDMRDEEGKTLMEHFPDIMFYDYTKLPERMQKNQLPNYHLTFSRSETNEATSLKLLKQGFNVAVVFGPGKTANRERLTYPDARPLLPAVWYGFKVIDGDGHDLRFLEQQQKGAPGLVVGLTAKGAATFESYSTTERKFLGTSGFVVQPNDPGITRYPENKEFIRAATRIINERNTGKQNQTGQYVTRKAKYIDEQRIIAGLLSGKLQPEELEKLSTMAQYKRLIGRFQEIEAYCRMYPSMCARDYLPKATKQFLVGGNDTAGEPTFSPAPFDMGQLQQIGLISGSRRKTPSPPSEEEKESDFKAWMAKKTRIPLPVG